MSYVHLTLKNCSKKKIKKKSNKSKALPAYKGRNEIYNLAYLSHQGVQPDDEFWSFYSRKHTQISLDSSCTGSGEVTQTKDSFTCCIAVEKHRKKKKKAEHCPQKLKICQLWL